MLKFKTFKNGLRVIIKKIDGLLSVTTGVIVGAGSIDENFENNGISHFIEHMMFKGTTKRTSFEISDSIDRIGAQINAFTSKEMTCYYTKSTTEHLEKSLEILADLFFNSTYQEEELNKERGVILEEISMANDTPEDLCLDILAEAFYGKEGLGQTILGSVENVSSFKKKDILKYMQENYYPENVVVSIAGNVDIDKTIALVESYFAENFKESTNINKKKNLKEDKIFNNNLFLKKEIEQLHIGLAMPSITLDNSDVNALNIANTILGGGMSSRLFQKVREELGLAYSVYSYLSAYQNSGIMTVYAGINSKNKDLTVNSILKEIKNFKDNKITEDEFLRGREQVKSAFIMGQESTSSQMLLYGKQLLFLNKEFNFENKIEEINALTIKDINNSIDKYFTLDFIASSCVGKDAEKIF